jgi:hypothetical protein
MERRLVWADSATPPPAYAGAHAFAPAHPLGTAAGTARCQSPPVVRNPPRARPLHEHLASWQHVMGRSPGTWNCPVARTDLDRHKPSRVSVTAVARRNAGAPQRHSSSIGSSCTRPGASNAMNFSIPRALTMKMLLVALAAKIPRSDRGFCSYGSTACFRFGEIRAW